MIFVKCGGQRNLLANDNVYAVCPDCGEEFKFDLIKFVEQHENIDFEQTVIYCEDCSKELLKK